MNEALFFNHISDQPQVGSGAALFYAGNDIGSAYHSNVAFALNANGVQILNTPAIGTSRQDLSGVGFNNVGIFYGGRDSSDYIPTRFMTTINVAATITGNEVFQNGTDSRANHASARVSNVGVFYAGTNDSTHTPT